MIHTRTSAGLIKPLERGGGELASVRGSHHVFRRPDKPGHINVPHPRKDLGKGLAHTLLKLAGLK
ncbi:type II toxin-antitoxin system HicA family toxin [Thauera aromatica]|nr:type II toxin-antitoxin system HicA family toxin [Thauera aromatica]MCK2127352.1 type II toxin-antitoxin system HicA family toxin [Thauera aromatica]